MAKNKKEKLRNNKVFFSVWIPILCFLLVLGIGGNIAADYWSQTFDWYFGRGELVAGSSELDADYYDMPYERTTEGKISARDNGVEVTEKINDEGEVLLKNDGTLPLTKGDKVTPLGYRYTDPIYGGTGSGSVSVEDYFVTLDEAMDEYFDVNTAIVSKMNAAKVTYLSTDGYVKNDGTSGDYSGATTTIAEYDPSIYSSSDVGSYTTAIVFIGREGGEGDDLQADSYYDGTAHQLELSQYERQTIEFAKTYCDKVIIIINSANALELGELEDDDEINAILWVGIPGSVGFKSMAKILCGEVNPSGKLVDTYAADALSSAAAQNLGDNTYAGTSIKYVEYEEGIYVGYRYYETAADLGYINYDEEVVYSFGYGLNYDDDKVTQTLKDVTYDESAGTITVTGTITNASTQYDVKEVVQIYFNPPYNENSGIEKATKNLVAFAKYEVAKNSSYDFSVTFDIEDMASYDYMGYYTDGSGSYVLESGDYVIYLGEDSHNSFGSSTVTLSETLVYADKCTGSGCTAVGKRSSDETVATNLFDDSNKYMTATASSHESGYSTDDYCVNLSRSSFADTFPTSSDGKQMPSASAAIFDEWDNTQTLNYNDEITATFGSEAPVSNADNGLVLSDMRGLDYDDEKWDELLDQIDYSASDLKALIGKAAYATGALESIGKAATTDVDGPQGLSKVNNVNAYCGEIVLGSTWNVELAQEMGEAVGVEMITQTRVGWYAPAMNIHRTPFSGRNYEYFSEDPVLSGYMAAYEVSGAAKYGVVSYIKHFAINDQETNRKKVCTYANEQAMREIYFKPFEICVKVATVEVNYYKYDEATDTYTMATKTMKATTGVMSSMNCTGALANCQNYSLLTSLLRGEWGFEGTVISDSLDTTYNIDAAVQAGNDLWLWYIQNSLSDTSSTAMQLALRNAVHNIAYSYANSLLMQNVAPGSSAEYGISGWQIVQIVANVVVWAGVAVIAAFIVYRIIDKKKRPDKYVSEKQTTEKE